MPATEMLTEARKLAVPLADIVEKQKLYSNINGNNHVKCEGWATLGSMLGITAKEQGVSELEDGSFEAKVELVNIKNGMTIGSGLGYCGMDERNWKTKPKYARRSMAITRATSKAYKTNFSWIFALAGYDTTPAEEMDGVVNVSHGTSEEYSIGKITSMTAGLKDDAARARTLAYIQEHSTDNKKMTALYNKLKEATK